MLAHLLTALRLLLALPVAAGMARPELLGPPLLLGLLLLAIASDWLDGKAARRFGTASPAGQLFDHATDFLFVTSGLAGAALAGALPWPLPPMIVVAFAQYVLDSRFLYRQKQLRMSFLGRWNGIFYFVPLVLLAAARLEALEGAARALAGAAVALAWVLVLSTLLSIVDRAVAPFRKMR